MWQQLGKAIAFSFQRFAEEKENPAPTTLQAFAGRWLCRLPTEKCLGVFKA